MAAQAPTDFRSFFNRLPSELREMIWEEAVIMDHGGHNRIVPLTQDTKRIIIIADAWARESGVFLACHEARSVALRLHSVALPVVPFYGLHAFTNMQVGLRPEGRRCDAMPPQPPGRRLLRISPSVDLFFVTAQPDQFFLNMQTGDLWTTLTPVGRPRRPATPGQNGLPRLMTGVVPPAVRASVVHAIDHRDVWGDLSNPQDEPVAFSVAHEHLDTTGVMAQPTPPGQVIHHFSLAEYSSARVCYHVENDVSNRGAYRFERRLLAHLGQGYTSQQMLDWLNPDFCRL